MSSVSQHDRELLKRLNNHPDLKNRLESILSIAEDSGDGIIKADDAEMRIVEEVRQMGNEVLTSWAESQIDKAAADLRPDKNIARSGKKKFTGTAFSAKSK